MADLYDGFITNLQSRKKRKPRYNSIGLPILPPEQRPKVDKIGLPKRDTREKLLRTKADFLDLLSKWGHRKEKLDEMVSDYAMREWDDNSVKQVRNLPKLQALEEKRRRGEELTGEEWRDYSNWTLITDELLARISGVKPIELNSIEDEEDIPEQFKNFITNPDSKPQLIAFSTGEGAFGERTRHATIFLRHIVKQKRGGMVIIEHYDPSGQEEYMEREELGNAVGNLIAYAGGYYQDNGVGFRFDAPTEQSYQSTLASVSCSRMCILRMKEMDKPIDDFVDKFYSKRTGKLLLELTDEITSQELNKHRFQDEYYPEIEADILKRKAELDAELPEYRRLKTIRYNLKRAPETLAKIEEYLPTAPSEETPA